MATDSRRAGARIPVAVFLPLVAMSLGAQRHASLRAGGDLWHHAAGVHIVATATLAAAFLIERSRHDRTPTANSGSGTTRAIQAQGAVLLAVSTLLVLWSQNTLSFAATGIVAITGALLALRATGSPARAMVVPVLVATAGVLLLIFGRNVGLGLEPGPALYLPLSRGPRQPDVSTLLSLIALTIAGAAWAGLWRCSRRHGYQHDEDVHTGNTLLLVAPGTATILAVVALTGGTPSLDPWVMLGGISFAVTVHGTMRLAADASPAAAGVAALGGCLASALVTRVHYGNAFTAPMLAGAGIVAAGLLLTRRQVRLQQTSRTETS